MIKTSGRILKSKDVELEGQYRLDAAPAKGPETGPLPTQTTPVSKQARILENHPEYAVVEVTCSCGARMVLRCEYAGEQMPDNLQVQNDTQTVSSQTK
ncbi:MAG: hypothetical protein JSW66_08850 [Phycisphaerales bacterium]|nr:MAG: hypothetical protein JSW66_08850 [Phycisphaerales bacterium]